jgi:hypothetical protein
MTTARDIQDQIRDDIRGLKARVTDLEDVEPINTVQIGLDAYKHFADQLFDFQCRLEELETYGTKVPLSDIDAQRWLQLTEALETIANAWKTRFDRELTEQNRKIEALERQLSNLRSLSR